MKFVFFVVYKLNNLYMPVHYFIIAKYAFEVCNSYAFSDLVTWLLIPVEMDIMWQHAFTKFTICLLQIQVVFNNLEMD